MQNSTSHFETILKIILAPEDPPEAFVQNYTLRESRENSDLASSPPSDGVNKPSRRRPFIQ